jgi:hypothetical protein
MNINPSISVATPTPFAKNAKGWGSLSRGGNDKYQDERVSLPGAIPTLSQKARKSGAASVVVVIEKDQGGGM